MAEGESGRDETKELTHRRRRRTHGTLLAIPNRTSSDVARAAVARQRLPEDDPGLAPSTSSSGLSPISEEALRAYLSGEALPDRILRGVDPQPPPTSELTSELPIKGELPSLDAYEDELPHTQQLPLTEDEGARRPLSFGGDPFSALGGPFTGEDPTPCDDEEPLELFEADFDESDVSMEELGLWSERLGRGPDSSFDDVMDDAGHLPPTLNAAESIDEGALPPMGETRYTDLGPLGAGGMGEVRRARDRVLGRVVAMKLIHPDFAHKSDARTRFGEEVQIVAQLSHPGIVPVYDTGELGDGRPYFTMPEVRGRHLNVIVKEVHRAASARGWTRSASGWTFRRLMSAFIRACEAMAHAHGRGVIHRDLKPSNIIVDDRCGVTVVDWGLARVVGNDRSGTWPELGLVVLDPRRAPREHPETRVVRGTPPYMAPEQALADEQTLQGDVYALGVILYEILAGRPPYEGRGISVVREQASHNPPDLSEVIERPVSDALIAICNRAMARDRSERYADASELVAALLEWSEGSLGQERAEALVAEAEDAEATASRLRDEASELRQAAEALSLAIPTWAPDARKLPGWTLEDRARELEREAVKTDARAERLLQTALLDAPRLPAAHAALARRFADRHQEAELTGDEDAQLRAEQRLQLHIDALPQRHPARTRFAAYLTGQGALTLLTDPSDAEVHIYRYAERRRRHEPRYLRSLGRTPLVEVSLPMGSYLLVIERAGHLPVRYPITVGRQGHWNPTPPHADAPQPVRLPLIGSLGPEEVYVPGGWFTAGGDRDQPWAMPERWLWLDGFIIQRVPVTNHRYLAMLNDLVRRGHEDEVISLVPRDATGQPCMVRNARGAMELATPRGGGPSWRLEEPVRLVSWHGAAAYARWWSERTGQDWRLPHEFEWEKAARGTDGRLFPWGDRFDPAWCAMTESFADQPAPVPVEEIASDESPYGVLGAAGNVSDWCLNLASELPEPNGLITLPDPNQRNPHSPRAVRGGSWGHDAHGCLVHRRCEALPDERSPLLGFRLARRF